MKRTTLIFFLAMCVNIAYGQDFISIKGKSPFPERTRVVFTGYNDFQKVDLGSIRATANGEIDYFTDYHGYCTMKAEDGKKVYPLLLYNDPTCISFDSLTTFSCEEDNAILYEALPVIEKLDSSITAFYNASDSTALQDLEGGIADGMDLLEALIQKAHPLDVATILQGEKWVLKSRMVKSTEELTLLKEGIMAYIDENYDLLFNTHLLITLADAYTASNRIFPNPESVDQVKVYDVAQWINNLGERVGERELVNFFLIHFSTIGDKDVALQLVSKYVDVVKCEQYVSDRLRPASMPYEFSVFTGPDLNRVISLDQFHGIDKVLAIYSTDCPASAAAVVGFYSFMSSNQIRKPVILVPSDGELNELSELIKKEAPFGMQSGMKTGSGLMLGAGVKQLPAFIMLDSRNLLKKIYYDLNELKSDLIGD